MNNQKATQDWYNILALARITASEDLRASNDLLSVVDLLMSEDHADNILPEQRERIAKDILSIALRLTDHSKELSLAVSKLVGVI